ncbi:FMN-binding protein [Pseudonocardia xishanensis]|uniref:FMN-binding protein n=1 Tax=Pseudonocardia xishanensis TaxID=630995 RepID=A0ABP8RT48_9PSEU
MRRIVTWLLATVAVVVLLFGYKTSTGSAAAPATSVAAPAAGSQARSASNGSFTGESTSTEWGDVQVVITVAGGRITDVQVPVYPDGNRRDQQINARALPVLTRETLAAQSADIDMVSGATVTSEGYLGSLQSALDQAGLA